MGYTPHVLIVGGGATGTAVARDLAIRGLEVTLVERGTLTAGATGRAQGILDSGARHAQSNPELARRLAAERRTLGEIASHCVTDTDGLLVTNDDTADERVAACEECGIDVDLLAGDAPQQVAPSLDDDVTAAIRTPDAVLDPFRVTVATARDAQEHGAEIRTHTTVTDIVVEGGAVVAVDVVHDPPPRRPADGDDGVDDGSDDSADTPGGAEDSEAPGDGADGPDGDDEDSDDGATGGEEPPDGDEDDAETEGAEAEDEGEDDGGVAESQQSTAPDIPGLPGAEESEKDVPGGGGETNPEKSEERIEADYVVNAAGPWADSVAAMAGFHLDYDRTEWPLVVADGSHVETVVTQCGPDGIERTVSPYDDHCMVGAVARDGDGMSARPSTTASVVDEAATIVPSLAETPLLRSFDAVRAGPDESVLLDHGRRDDCWGMTTVLGGTLTTHRAVAERVADQVCGEFGITRDCRTDEIPLPGSDGQVVWEDSPETYWLDSDVAERSRDRLGSRAGRVLATSESNPVLCPCKSVTRAEVQDAMDDPSADPADLEEIRIRTSATMGACQGGRCAHRLAAELYPDREQGTVMTALDDLLASRWAGQRDVLWGDQLARAMRTYQFQAGLLNRDHDPESDLDVSAFDDGPDDDGVADYGPRGGYPV